MLEKLTIDQVKCLIIWPENSHGAVIEEEALKRLIEIADLIGYGRLPQIVNSMKEIWDDPDTAIPKYQKQKEYRFKSLNYPEKL